MLDDQLLDARDMAEEIAEAKGELTTCKHDGMRKPCIFGCDDEERILNDIDAVVEQVARPRTFEDVINQWTEACLTENRSASDPAAILIVTRLGLLGQRLLYEANDLGMKDVMRQTREVLER